MAGRAGFLPQVDNGVSAPLHYPPFKRGACPQAYLYPMRNSSVSIPCHPVSNQEASRQANLIRTTSMLGSDIHRGWKSSLSRDSSVRRDDDNVHRFSVQCNGLEKLFLYPSGYAATCLKLRIGSMALSDASTSTLSLSVDSFI